MLEYKGYVIVQTDEDGFHDIVAYQNGRFAFQACTDSHLEDDELKDTVDQLLNLFKDNQKKQTV